MEAGRSAAAVDERFVRAVEAIYATAAAPAQWPFALEAIARCFDDVGANLLYRRDDGSFGTVVSPGLHAAQLDYQREWWRHDIRAARSVEYGYRTHAGALTDRHIITSDEITTHPFYTEFLAQHGLRWVAGLEVSPDPRVLVAVAVQRASGKPPYSDEELGTLTRLGRHAEQALRLSIRLLDAELSNMGLREALSRLGIGVFALDSLGRVVFANPAGKRVLGDGLAIVDGRLRVGRTAARDQVEKAIALALRGELKALPDPKPLLIERSLSLRPLVTYVLPVGMSSAPADEFLTHTRAIVLVIDPQSGDPPDPAVVRDVLGLTLGEARIAAMVGSGLPPREAAERLGIAEETARAALKRVFSKVGVSRQSELAALMTKLVLR